METVRLLAGITQIAIALVALGLTLGVFEGEMKMLGALVAIQNGMNGIIRCRALDQPGPLHHNP